MTPRQSFQIDQHPHHGSKTSIQTQKTKPIHKNPHKTHQARQSSLITISDGSDDDDFVQSPKNHQGYTIAQQSILKPNRKSNHRVVIEVYDEVSDQVQTQSPPQTRYHKQEDDDHDETTQLSQGQKGTEFSKPQNIHFFPPRNFLTVKPEDVPVIKKKIVPFSHSQPLGRFRQLKPFQFREQSSQKLLVFTQHCARMSLSIIRVIKQSWLKMKKIQYEQCLQTEDSKTAFQPEDLHESHKSLLQSILETIYSYGNERIITQQSVLAQHENDSIILQGQQGKIQTQTESSDSQILCLAQRHMQSYFLDGVYVPSNLLNQERFMKIPEISFNRINKSRDQIHFENVLQTPGSMYKKIIFCPTTLVTGQIFNHICHPQQPNIFSGQYGIGKTHAFILYRLMSSQIYAYYHLARKQGIMNQQGLEDFLSDNSTSGENSEYIPKMIYLSLNSQTKKQQIIQNIKLQCLQLKQLLSAQQKNQGFKIKNKWSVQDLYFKELGIKVLMSIDQINVLAGQERLCSKFQQNQIEMFRLRQKICSPSLNEQQKQKANAQLRQYKRCQSKILYKCGVGSIESLQRRIKSNMQSLEIIRENFKNLIFLSSVNFESQIYKAVSIDQLSQTNKQVVFHSFLNSKLVYYDFSEYIMTKLKKLPNIKHLQYLQDLTAKSIYDQIKDYEYLPFIPLHIQSVFADLQNDLNYSSTTLQLLIKYVQNASIFWIQSKIQNFIHKDLEEKSGKRSLILLQLVLKSKQILKNHSSSQSSQFLHFQTPIAIDSPQFKDELNHQIFRYNFKKKQICLNIHPLLLLNIYKNMKKSIYSTIYAESELFQILIQNPVMKGLVFETIMIEIFSLEKTHAKLKTFSKDGSKWKENVIKMNFQDKIKYAFQSIPKSRETTLNYKFLNSFRQKFMGKKYDGWRLFMPVHKDKISKAQQEINANSQLQYSLIDYSSKSIDFIISGVVEDNIKILAFDVTISVQSVNKKIAKFYTNFKQYFDEKWGVWIQNKKVEIEYYILLNRIQPGQEFKISKVLKETEAKFSKGFDFEDYKNTCMINHRLNQCALKKISVISLDFLELSNVVSEQFTAYYSLIKKLK